ncbi:multicopper oxidase type 3 [Fictibacillus macauensis ZFHKF-1]|uniref:Multicopper oxidase type 3 n=1 Tax=Fictibacillus macauensis ZFHKF-1 TaxID=1196324 RepID=I8AFY8_9BACL|nr:multicopper oxidase family protein [Fictibacillus macauensis]EIT84304.1 multicopper oxidase type 3 [Fictibacillus macauensis ZFHKF-1]
MKKQWSFLLLLIGVVVLITACSQKEAPRSVKVKKESFQGLKVNRFTLVAQEKMWQLSKNKQVRAWTYGGTVPGTAISVKQGEVVSVKLVNQLKQPISIHWHGVPLPNTEDGIPGQTQDAVAPNETYTYQFIAKDAGTYWYHSHQDSVNQVDKGLYGTFVVTPKKEEKPKMDVTYVLDEWQSGKQSMTSMSGMTHDMSSYNLFTVNGKTAELRSPLRLKKGDEVRMRFINAGYMVHTLHVPTNFKVVALDGQTVKNPRTYYNQTFAIAPGERYDLLFIFTGKGFTIDSHDASQAAKQMNIAVKGENKSVNHPAPAGHVTLSSVSASETASQNIRYDRNITMKLGTAMKKEQMVYTINGKTAPSIPPINVTKGEKVKVTFSNETGSMAATHPMHLHGHFFQVLTRNGKKVQGNLMKDTLNVQPGETYEVVFAANNPGNWMFHCHDLHHASAGMMTKITYNHFQPFYKDSGKVKNSSE